MNFHYQPLVSWPFFFGIISALALIAMTGLFFQRKKGIPPSRIGLRLLFFLGFAVCLSMAVLRPQHSLDRRESQILVYEDELDRKTVDFWRDSLKIRRALPLSKFQAPAGMIFLLGERFDAAQLYPLKDLDVEWILPERTGAIRKLDWKGYLRKGEMQRVAYDVFSESDSARLEIQGSKLEPKRLKKGWNAGLLEFYPSGLNRAEFPLVLERDTLTSLRFFIGAARPKKYHFQLGFPSAESRTLSSWLAEKGEQVTEKIKLSSETVIQSGSSPDSLQILLIDPAQLDQRSVQDWVKTGQAVLLVMNVGKPDETAQVLNRLFGTDFQVRQTGQNEVVKLESGLEILPFEFVKKPAQKLTHDGAVAIQYSESTTIALSLVSASYPLALQGKSEEYERLWGDLFGKLEPHETESWRMSAPLLSSMAEPIQRLSEDSLPDLVAWGKDTVFFHKSAVNPFLSEGQLQSSDSSWIELDSTFAAYVYGKGQLQALHTAALIDGIKDRPGKDSKVAGEILRPISPWIWLGGMLLFLGLLWLEPKLGY